MLYRRVLYTHESVGRMLLTRAGLIVALLALSAVVLYFERDGLKDAKDGELSFPDIVYFMVITVTTVGYGDIVPVSTFARMFDTFFLTAIRIVSWLIIFGTAYEILIQREMEGWKMRRVKKGLKEHIIVCGFDQFGKNIARELISIGVPKNKIVVIDTSESAMHDAAELGVIGLRGDATMEAILEKAAIRKAKYVIAAAGRDDTNILICLTAKHLNKYVEIIGSIMENENIPLIKQSGADVVISPLSISSHLIATAISDKQKYSHILKELKF